MKQTFKYIISGLATFAAVAALWMCGYSVGSDKNTALVDFVKEDREKLRNQVTQLLGEIESLKLQLSANINSIQASNLAPKVLSDENFLSSGKKTKDIIYEERSIQSQNTELFFDGDIGITLIATNYSGSPLRYRVFANVLIPGYEPFEIRDADPGSAFKIGDFQVVIINSGTLAASFKVYKLQK